MPRKPGRDEARGAYNGSPPAATSLAAGDTQALMTVAPALLPMIQSGRVKLLGATSTKRSEVLKDVPTLAEQGYPEFEALDHPRPRSGAGSVAWCAYRSAAFARRAVHQDLGDAVGDTAAA